MSMIFNLKELCRDIAMYRGAPVEQKALYNKMLYVTKGAKLLTQKDVKDIEHIAIQSVNRFIKEIKKMQAE